MKNQRKINLIVVHCSATRASQDFLEGKSTSISRICSSSENRWEVFLKVIFVLIAVHFFHYFKVFLVYSSAVYSVASGVKDELTVTVDTDDVSLASFENACFHTQFYMVFGKYLEWVSKKDLQQIRNSAELSAKFYHFFCKITLKSAEQLKMSYL